MRRSTRGPRLEILPLIDVVFLLLVIFLFSMARMIRSYAIPVDLPALTTGRHDASEEPAVLVIGLDAKGGLSVAGKPIAWESLRDRVAEARARDGQLAVLLNADENARHGVVVSVFDRLRRSGQERVWIVGREVGGTP